MTDTPKPSTNETTVGDIMESLLEANRNGELDGEPKPNNDCDHCGRLIEPGEQCWMTTLTEITADNAPFFPSAFDIKYPFRLFCSDECCRDFWWKLLVKAEEEGSP
jgi:hypothetical protein